MEKLTFQRNKYGIEILIDTIHTSEFSVDSTKVLPNFYTIAYLKEATGNVRINNQDIPLSNDMIIIIPSSQSVDIQNALFNDGYFIFFEGEFLDKFFNETNFVYKFSYFHNTDNPFHVKIQGKDTEIFFELFENVNREIKEFSHDSEHLVRAYLYQLLIILNRQYARAYSGLNPQLLTNDYLLKFRHALEREIKNHHDVQFYADFLRISRTYLNQLCKDFYAKTSNTIIKERLALEIKKELLFTTKTVAEIAYEYNFSDPPNFSRFFSKMTSYSPQYFRELSK